jgi:hypothetical protein
MEVTVATLADVHLFFVLLDFCFLNNENPRLDFDVCFYNLTFNVRKEEGTFP